MFNNLLKNNNCNNYNTNKNKNIKFYISEKYFKPL